MTEPASEGVPLDTFPVRLAIVRTVMGWNYDQAARATGIKSETWRLWEKGQRRCTDITGVATRLSEVTGLSENWIALGGPLATAPARGGGGGLKLLPRLDSNQQPADLLSSQVNRTFGFPHLDHSWRATRLRLPQAFVQRVAAHSRKAA